MEEEQVVAALIVALLVDDDDSEKMKRGNTRNWIRKRNQKGFHTNIVEELRLGDTGVYKEMMRMDYECILNILNYIGPHISPTESYRGAKNIIFVGQQCWMSAQTVQTAFLHANNIGLF